MVRQRVILREWKLFRKYINPLGIILFSIYFCEFLTVIHSLSCFNFQYFSWFRTSTSCCTTLFLTIIKQARRLFLSQLRLLLLNQAASLATNDTKQWRLNSRWLSTLLAIHCSIRNGRQWTCLLFLILQWIQLHSMVDSQLSEYCGFNWWHDNLEISIHQCYHYQALSKILPEWIYFIMMIMSPPARPPNRTGVRTE